LAHAFETEDGIFTVETQYRWPSDINGGFWPFYAVVENNINKPQTGIIDIQSYGSFNINITQEVALGPHETRSVEIMVPAWIARTVTATFTHPNGNDLDLGNLGPRKNVQNNCITISDLDIENGCFWLPPDQLPLDPVAYTSVQGVLLDLRHPPEGPALDALSTWVQWGGLLYVLDPDGLLESDPHFAPWVQKRFLRDEQQWAMGLGSLNLSDHGRFSRYAPTLTPLQTLTQGITVGPYILPIPGDNDIPEGSFAGLLVSLLLTLGPLNYLLVRKMGQATFWLVSTPTLALLSTAGIGIYGVTVSGFDLHTSSRSLSLLDQRDHQLSTIEMRSYYSGNAPPDRLHLPDGTWAFPLGDGDSLNYDMQIQQGRHLSGNFIGIRVNESNLVLHHSTSRRRLEIQGSHIQNLLGVDIEQLVYHAPDDTWWYSAALKANAEAQLLPLESYHDMIETILNEDAMMGYPYVMVPNSYAATLASPGVISDDGVDFSELASQHTLIGIL
jgi:hypothetical protein